MKRNILLAGTILSIASLVFPNATFAQDVQYYKDQVMSYLQRCSTYKYLIDHGYQTLRILRYLVATARRPTPFCLPTRRSQAWSKCPARQGHAVRCGRTIGDVDYSARQHRAARW